MTATLFLQGSLAGLNSRDGRPLFMEPVAGRPLLGQLLEAASALRCFDRLVFVTSAERCDGPVVEYLRSTWPAVETVRVEAGSPFAFGPASRRSGLLSSASYAGIFSVDGFKALAAPCMRDPAHIAFVLDVSDAPLCSSRTFEQALSLAREGGFCAGVGSGETSLCGFPVRALGRIGDHQRALRVGDASAALERAERAVQEIRREGYLASEEEVETVHAWKRARAERYGPKHGGALTTAVRDWISRHGDAEAQARFRSETAGEAVTIVTRRDLEMARAAGALPGSGDVADAAARFYPDFPSYLEVELTSRCNLACPFCPQTKLTRPKGDLEHEAFVSLLDRVGDFVFLLNFSGFGEPTLHPRLFEFVRLAKSRGIPRVEIETNGTGLDEAFLDAAFESGLDILAVNLDALDEAGGPRFGSVFELLRRFSGRRGAEPGGDDRPFIVLQRVNMAVAGQDARIQRDFALWHDVADAVVIRPFNSYRGTFDDKRVIDFSPLERQACRKLLASALVLSSGEAVMCEQCFDGPPAEGPAGAPAVLAESGESAGLRQLRFEQSRGLVGEFCAPCTQWYQRDVAWQVPGANRSWFEAALARAAQGSADEPAANGRETATSMARRGERGRD